MKNQIIFALLISAITFQSCSNGVNLDTMENVPISLPIKIFGFTSDEEYAAALDKDGYVWQWKIDKDYNIEKIEKVNISNVHSMGLNLRTGRGWAVTKSGEVNQWSVNEPSKVRPLETKKPVKKFILYGYFSAALYTDGTVERNYSESKDSIHFSKFKDLKDIYYTKRGDAFAGITYSGEVIAACGTGLNSMIIEQEPTNNGIPVKIDKLKDIKRFYELRTRYYVAIDENDEIYYWGQGFKKQGIQKFDKRGNNVHEYRILTKEGINHEIPDNTKYGGNLSTGPSENLPFPEGYGLWYLYYKSNKAIGLDKEGKLWLFNYDADKSPSERITNPKRIGDFIVNLDYYRS